MTIANLKRGLVLTGVVFSLHAVSAANYYFKSTATDFSVPANYTVGSATGPDATVVPGPDDIVIMPTKTATYEVTAGTENFFVFSQIGEFRAQAWNPSTFRLNVPSGTLAITNMFNHPNGSASRDTARWTILEKVGAGELILSGFDRYPATHKAASHWNYEVTLRVKEGALSFDMSNLNSGSEIVIGILDVSTGATVKVPYRTDKDLTLTTGGFSGGGLITNECTTAGRRTYLQELIGNYSQAFKLSGAIGGPIHPTFTSENDLRGNRSTYTYNVGISANDSGWTDAAGTMNGSNLRRITVVDMIGKRGEPSPLGMGNIVFSQFGGEIYYDGTGEETDKIVQFAHTTENGKLPHCWNAGTVGGLIWKVNGSNTYWEQSSQGRDTRCILRGENTKPCVINCPIKANSSGYTQNFMKRGSGKWVFANAANSFSGAIFVEEGTLGFMTLKEAGTTSSLGTSWRLHKWYDGGVSQADWNQLDGKFAFTLGCPTNAATVGALEFLGSDITMCKTRPFGLNGTGGILNNGTGRLLVGNATVATEGKQTALYLGGTNTMEATFYNVTNGVGEITVVKDGSGTWNVVNDVDIDAVEVKGGTLVLEKTTGAPYSWFRFIQKEALNIDDHEKGVTNAVGPYFPIQQELVLYDAAGNRQLINPDYQETADAGGAIWSPRDYRLIGPNSLAYDSAGSVGNEPRGATNLFDNAALGAGMWLSRFNGSGTFKPTITNASSWVKIIMRMPEDAPAITSCDIVIDGSGGWGSELAAWALEGSRDGIAWEPITNVCWKTSLTEYTKHRRSWSGKAGAKGCYCYPIDQGMGVADYGWVPGDTTPRPNMGYPFGGVVTNQYIFPTSLSSVKVSGGGKLKIVADVPPTVNSLTVDATSGGTITNITYAASGTLSLVNVGSESSIAVPGRLYGFNKEGWTVNLPAGCENRIVDVKDGKITITKRGLVIIVQ